MELRLDASTFPKLLGWRCGWVISPRELTPQLRAVHDQMVLQAPTPIQIGCEALLQLPVSRSQHSRHGDGKLGGDLSYYEKNALKYKQSRDYFLSELEKLGFGVTYRQSAYYASVRFCDVPTLVPFTGAPLEACMFLLKECSVACVPGDNFYTSSGGERKEYLRFCFCRRMGDLEEAVRRLQKLKG